MALNVFPIILLIIFSCNSNVNNTQKEAVTANQPRVENQKTVAEKKSTDALYLEHQGLVNIHSLDKTLKIDLKYATTDNFTKVKLYDNLTEGYLHPLAAKKLAKAQQLLKKINPDYSLLVYDAARPISVQKKMFAVVQNSKHQAYVANPTRSGLHNYGMAVDLTICQSNGKVLDMGTPFDYFGKAAGINQEDQLVAQGILSRKQVENRKLLRSVMVQAGFIAIRGEWWHFNAVSLGEAKRTAKLIK